MFRERERFSVTPVLKNKRRAVLKNIQTETTTDATDGYGRDEWQYSSMYCR
jgi:hypothetical protein